MARANAWAILRQRFPALLCMPSSVLPVPGTLIRMEFDWTQGALAEGLRNYNAGDFFTAHEDWESVWLHAPQPDKTFLQALIQVTVALHHLQRNNPLGATRLLTAALHKLETYPSAFAGIAVTLLRDDIHDRLQTLAATQPATHVSPPRIQLNCL